MKQLLITTALLILCVGCNVNESKEGRIQKLEAQSQQTTTKLQELEQRIQTLESSGLKDTE